MKTMSKSLARGYFQSRSFSGGTQVAGMSLFLPTNEVPVVQTLTRHQIAAIPKERFSAREFGAENCAQIISAMKMAGKRQAAPVVQPAEEHHCLHRKPHQRTYHYRLCGLYH